MKPSQETTYLFLNEKYEVIKTYTTSQIQQIYHINNMEHYLNTHRCINGYLVIEELMAQEQRVKFYSNEKFNYYCSINGMITKINKKTHQRTILQGFMQDGARIIRLDGKIYGIARLVLELFYQKQEKDVIIQYEDNNPLNCHLENLYVISRSEYLQEKRISKQPTHTKSVYYYKNDQLVQTFPTIIQALQELNISRKQYHDYLDQYKSELDIRSQKIN